jgi:manganese efflux pump family protein
MFLGVLAGLDNLQVAAAISLTPITRARRVLFALAFCAFEISTPLAGLLLVRLLHARFGAWIDRASPLIIVSCGVVILLLALKGSDDLEKLVNNRWTVVGLPLSLSFDNLLIGVSLGTFGYPLPLAAAVVGSVSACMCLIGMAGGTRLRRWIPDYAQVVSGLYLIAIAAMMWMDHRA